MKNERCFNVEGGGFIGIHIASCLLSNDIPVRVFGHDNLRIRKILGDRAGLEVVTEDVYNK